MKNTNRRDLLKITAAGAVAGLGLAGASGPAEAAPGDVKVVQIHGSVSNPAAGTVEISITVAGPRDGLSGAGWDDDPAPGVAGACLFTQAGSADSKTVTLSGRVLFSNNPGFLDAPVTTVADFQTGEITWTFGPFVFTGTGTVVRR